MLSWFQATRDSQTSPRPVDPVSTGATLAPGLQAVRSTWPRSLGWESGSRFLPCQVRADRAWEDPKLLAVESHHAVQAYEARLSTGPPARVSITPRRRAYSRRYQSGGCDGRGNLPTQHRCSLSRS